ncbi:MAG: hypothetical protein KKF44_06445 [Nanoarchaeota archaeon]|nr:hypothetical protein [Nanoarchaeota archaeon]
MGFQNLEALLKHAELGRQVQIGPGAAVWPIYSARGTDLCVVTWRDALKKGLVQINTKGGSIGDASVTNKSNKPILMPAGIEISPVTHGQQERVTASSHVIEAGQTADISSLRCGQASAGISQTKLATNRSLAVFPSARAAASNQEDLWSYIRQVGELGVFDDIKARESLAALLGEQNGIRGFLAQYLPQIRTNYAKQAGNFARNLAKIPKRLGVNSILSHLVVYLDPLNGTLDAFIEGYGNSGMYVAERQGLNTGLGGQATISQAKALDRNINVGFEVTEQKAIEVIAAFKRGDLSQPNLMPEVDYGVSVNTTNYGQNVVHFDGSAREILK